MSGIFETPAEGRHAHGSLVPRLRRTKTTQTENNTKAVSNHSKLLYIFRKPFFKERKKAKV